MSLKTEHAKQGRREYFRKYRAKNKEKIQQHQESFYKRKFAENTQDDVSER